MWFARTNLTPAPFDRSANAPGNCVILCTFTVLERNHGRGTRRRFRDHEILTVYCKSTIEVQGHVEMFTTISKRKVRNRQEQLGLSTAAFSTMEAIRFWRLIEVDAVALLVGSKVFPF